MIKGLKKVQFFIKINRIQKSGNNKIQTKSQIDRNDNFCD